MEASTVNEMLDQLVAEQVTVDEAVRWVREHNWPPARTEPLPRSGPDYFVYMGQDSYPFPQGVVQQIAVAYHNNRIGLDTYRRLTEAYTDTQRADRLGT
jgi:hypothetical protein